MIYDDLDFFLIQSIYKAKKEISVWDITKKCFNNLNLKTREGKRELTHKYILVQYRLKKMKEAGFLFMGEKNGKNEYILIKELVKIGKHKFPNGYKNAILIKEDGKWMVFQL